MPDQKFAPGDKVRLTPEGLDRFRDRGVTCVSNEYVVERYMGDDGDGSPVLKLKDWGEWREKWFESIGGPW